LIISSFVWLLQDFLQVLVTRLILAPEIFLLAALYKLISGPQSPRRAAKWIWFVFFGGVLWDLRWASVPGMSGLLNVAALASVYWIWDRTPTAGRSALLFAAIAGGAHLFSGVIHYLAWALPGQAAMRTFAIQQLLMIPVLALLCVIYAFKASNTHV
jgi:uncharacterized membrane protein